MYSKSQIEKDLSQLVENDCRSTKISNCVKLRYLENEGGASDEISQSKVDRIKSSGISSVIAVNNNHYQGLSALMSLVKLINWKQLMGSMVVLKNKSRPFLHKHINVSSLHLEEEYTGHDNSLSIKPKRNSCVSNYSKRALSQLCSNAGEVELDSRRLVTGRMIGRRST